MATYNVARAVLTKMGEAVAQEEEDINVDPKMEEDIDVDTKMEEVFNVATQKECVNDFTYQYMFLCITYDM